MSFSNEVTSRSDGVRAVGFPLVFQFPNWSLQLPDYGYRGDNPDGYASKDEFIRFLENYTSTTRAPVRRRTEVLALSNSDSGRSMTLETSRGVIHASNVVVATGPFQAPKIPAASRNLPPEIVQIHAPTIATPPSYRPAQFSWSVVGHREPTSPRSSMQRPENFPRRRSLSQDTPQIQGP